MTSNSLMSRQDVLPLLKELKEQGNCHFKESQIEKAATCYYAALSKCHPDITAVLNNASISSRCLGDNWPALHYAIAASRISTQNVKTYYRIAEALLALNFCEETQSKEQLVELTRGATDIEPLRYDYFEHVLNLIIDHEAFVEAASYQDSNISTDISIPSSTLSDAKNSGNTFYRHREYEKAMCLYRMALATEQSSLVATLLLNLSACNLRQEKFVDAALDAIAALVIDPKSEKGFYRLATALTNMNKSSKALSFLKNAPATKGIEMLRERIDIEMRNKRVEISDHVSKLRQQYPTESEMQKFKSEIGIRASEDKIDVLEKLRKHSRTTLNFIDDRVNKFHERFFADGQWPRECNVSDCKEKLLAAYRYSRAQPSIELLLFNEKAQNDFQKTMLEEQMQRCDYDIHIYSRLQKAAIGDALNCDKLFCYNFQVINSFSNQPRLSMKVVEGSTHVSVGFVDLGELLNVEIEGKEGLNGFKWVGYEASEYAVAKTLVINEMLKMKVFAVDIMQVWFSATWTRQGLDSFRRALENVLNEGTLSSNDPAVKRVLIHWKCQDKGVSLKTARTLWLQIHPNERGDIASMKKECDQKAMCMYSLSGDLVLNPEVGSVVMFSLPPGVGEIALGESVFHCIPSETLIKYRLQNGCKDIISAAVDFLTEKIDLLSDRLCSGKIVTEIHLVTVCLENKDLLRTFSELEPTSMSWSNICDYIEPQIFHEMANLCSKEDTRHYLYPMNWLYEICGTFLEDYKDVEERIELRNQSIIELKRIYKEHDMLEFFHLPLMEHPANTVGGFLCLKYQSKWAKHFLEISEVPVDNVQVQPILYTVLLKSNSSFELSYTYTPKKIEI